ncbi:unnamed protein product [Urochloa humidicola]
MWGLRVRIVFNLVPPLSSHAEVDNSHGKEPGRRRSRAIAANTRSPSPAVGAPSRAAAPRALPSFAAGAPAPRRPSSASGAGNCSSARISSASSRTPRWSTSSSGSRRHLLLRSRRRWPEIRRRRRSRRPRAPLPLGMRRARLGSTAGRAWRGEARDWAASRRQASHRPSSLRVWVVGERGAG